MKKIHFQLKNKKEERALSSCSVKPHSKLVMVMSVASSWGDSLANELIFSEISPNS